MKKLKYLDGVRGLMALIVMLDHFTCVYYPQMQKLSWAEEFAPGSRLSIFASSPLALLVSGDMAVQYFFILCGFLTALSIFRREDLDIARVAARRYLRLMPVVMGATVFTFLLMQLGLMFHLTAAAQVCNTRFFTNYCNFTPTVKNLLENSFLQPFFWDSDYVGPFWTIRYEFLGYLLCVVVCWLFKGRPWRRLGYVLALLILRRNGLGNYCALMLGVILADLYACPEKDATPLARFYTSLIRKPLILAAAFTLGLGLASVPMEKSGIYLLLPPNTGSTYHFIGVAMCMWALLNWPGAQAVLETKPLQWLGKLSFCTYAFHWPLMLSLEAGVFLLLRRVLPYDGAALLSFAIALPAIYLVSWLTWRYLETPSGKLTKWLKL